MEKGFKGRFTLSWLFVLYFSFFAVSQLTYHCPDKNLVALTGKRETCFTSKLSFVLLELLSRNNTDNDDDSDDVADNDSILLRKKRAIVSYKNSLTRISLDANTPSEILALPTPAVQYSSFATDFSGCDQIASSFLSGLSPPSA